MLLFFIKDPKLATLSVGLTLSSMDGWMALDSVLGLVCFRKLALSFTGYCFVDNLQAGDHQRRYK